MGLNIVKRWNELIRLDSTFSEIFYNVNEIPQQKEWRK